MKKLLGFLAFISLLSALSTASTAAPNFVFKIPTIPFTPKISGISNTAIRAGAETFTVYATIEGDLQQKACCGAACDRTDCAMSEWYMKTDTDISPNPPCIPNENGQPGMPDSSCKKTGAANPVVYYYIDPDVDNPMSASMKYDESTGKFKADIPVDSSWVKDDIIKYYIVASDSRGNSVSMLPDKETASCTSLTSWRYVYQTPASDNCSMASSYEQCAKNYTGTPGCAGTADYSINDTEGDTCGVPDTSGNQSLVSSENSDILGFAASAGKGYASLPNDDVVCANIRIKGSAPTSSSGPIEGYLLMFFNPDITDPNPADLYFPNVFAITYAPEASGLDKNLVSVLWDGECVSNPNTSDILGCKIVVGNEGESKLKIGSNNHMLTFIAKNAVSTKTGDKTILGSTSNSLKIVGLTGEIDVTGSIPFWLVDLTSGLMLIKDTKEAKVVDEVTVPAAPLFKSTTCKANGTGDAPECIKSSAIPDNNQCIIDIYSSPDASSVSKYKVYHNTTNNAATAVYLSDLDITTNLTSSNSVTYTVPQASLDGGKHYFFFSSVGKTGLETAQKDWSATTAPCRVEDWMPPAAPTGASCSTPDGSESKCFCTWSPDASDPSLYGYNIKRDNSQLNGAIILGEQFTDNDSALTNGFSYSYSIQAIDVGNNESGWTTVSCTPQDLKSPSKPDTLSITYNMTQLGINATWQPVSDIDAATYNLYGCFDDLAKPGSCDTKGETTTTNGYSVLCTKNDPSTPETLSCSVASGFKNEGDIWCFYVEACDNCTTVGTCPGKTSPNCSNFDTMTTYLKCGPIVIPTDTLAPRWPENQSDGKEIKTTPPVEGNKCKLEWNKICTGEDSEGTFADCNNPDPFKLSGYYVMRAPAVNNDCSKTTITSPKDGGTPVATLNAMTTPNYTDTSLTNNTIYCYRVYGYDAAGNVSRDPDTPNPVECVPADTLPPAKPVADTENSFYSSEEGGNIVKWAAVSDKDTISYSVYRCEGDMSQCDSASDFELLDDAAELIDTEYTDQVETTSSKKYSYCITAKDLAGNISDKYNASDLANCFTCSEGPTLKSPGAVSAYEYDSQYGLKVNWVASADDDSAYDSGEGYNLYLCKYNVEASCTDTFKKINTSVVQQAGTDYIKTGTDLASLSINESDYYVWVSYANATSGESAKTVSTLPSSTGGKIHIKPNTCTDCPNTVKVNGKGTDGEIRYYSIADPQCASTTDCMKTKATYTYTALTDTRIELVQTSSPGTVISTVSTDNVGKPPDMKAPIGASNVTYTVRLRMPVSSSPVACTSKTTDYCYVTLKKAVTLPSTANSITVNVLDLPGASGNGGGDAGNPNCDSSVNLQDIMAIKNAYGAKSGETCYRAWADFNNDGTINLTDILAMKDSYGSKIDSVYDVSSAVLCSSKAPIPACCSTKTCSD